MIILGRLRKTGRWHVFVGGFQESLCGRVAVWDCEEVQLLAAPADVSKADGPVCTRCLKRLVLLGEIAEALNERVP
ncbi:MAG: hypothetical protein J7M26_03560 [Armatimonadetes bacterium]|nr:hypothetical protein [Armatimonadota bacterium]